MSNKVGIFIGEDNSSFFEDIYEEITTYYTTELYIRREYKLPFLYGRINRYAFRRGINALLRRNDICFFEWASELLAVASHLPKQCKIITRMHSFELYDWAPQVDWAAVDKVILVSQAMKARFIDLYPQHADKAEVVYNGIRLDKFKPPTSRRFSFKLGMLCNIIPIKRIYEVILLMDDLRSMGLPATLHIAGEPKGDFRYAQSVHRLVEKLELQDRVKFYGQVNDSASWLQDIDIFISNSYWEGQQVALLEAMAAGCYCLSHFWGGVEEVLPQENITISSDQLLKLIIQFAELSDVDKQASQDRLRDIACRKFDIENTKLEIRRIIDQLVVGG